MALSNEEAEASQAGPRAISASRAIPHQVVQAARATPGMWLSIVQGMVDLATKPLWWGMQQLSRGSGLLPIPKRNGE